jgi:hypothetical protein
MNTRRANAQGDGGETGPGEAMLQPVRKSLGSRIEASWLISFAACVALLLAGPASACALGGYGSDAPETLSLWLPIRAVRHRRSCAAYPSPPPKWSSLLHPVRAARLR